MDRGAGLQMPAIVTGRRRMLAAALAGLLACSGCGWRPLYARPTPDPASGGVGAAMAEIAIDPITTPATPDPLTGTDTALYDSRAAQLLQNHLEESLNPYGRPSTPAYHLQVNLSQGVRPALSLGNGQVTRQDLIMNASFHLRDSSGKAVLNDHAQSVSSYDILKEPFSDLSSQQDAMRRSTLELAQAIQTRIAVFFGK